MIYLKLNNQNLIRSLLIGLNFMTTHNTQFMHITLYFKTHHNEHINDKISKVTIFDEHINNIY